MATSKHRYWVVMAGAALAAVACSGSGEHASGAAADLGTGCGGDGGSPGPETCAPVVVDGKLDEAGWNVTTPAANSVIGTGNDAVTFGTRRDTQYLYVGVNVQDANVQKGTGALWDTDAVEVFVDPSDAKAGPYVAADRQYLVAAGGGFGEAGGHVTGVLHAVAAIPGGYSVELGIPLTDLGLATLSGASIGLDIANDDDDTGAGRSAQLTWSGTANDYVDTSAFGDVRFDAGGCAGTPERGTPPPPPPSSAGLLAPGRLYYGVNGHYGWDGYESVSDAQQIADMKDLFGTTPNTVVYRAWGGDGTDGATVATQIAPFLAAGILPSYVMMAYPVWSSYAGEADAYTKSYATTADFVAKCPKVSVFEIGNEWMLHGLTYSNDGSHVSDWTGAPNFPLALAIHAGVIAALRDKNPQAVVAGGASPGWTFWALAQALAEKLQSYQTPGGATRDLTWDFTTLHHYQDIGGGNQEGSTISGANVADYFTAMKAAGRALAITEIGSSTEGNAANEPAAAAQLAQFLDDMKAHTPTTATETGVRYFNVYQLYGPDQESYYLRLKDGTITPQGTAVKTWIAANGP